MITLDHDIVFSTYNDSLSKLDEFTVHLRPSKTFFTPQVNQRVNFQATLRNVLPLIEMNDVNNTSYDYIIFLRFEAIYKLPLEEWNFRGKHGLIVPFKEDSEGLFKREGFYNDNIIIVSNSMIHQFADAILTGPPQMFPSNNLHNIANIIKLKYPAMQVHCLVDGYFQSNTDYCTQVEGHLSPLYILTHYPYKGRDAALYGLPVLE